MSTTNRKNCPDCGGALRAIKLLDRWAHRRDHPTLLYTRPEAKPGFWLSYPIEGEVAALICEQCARIFLYGIAKREK